MIRRLLRHSWLMIFNAALMMTPITSAVALEKTADGYVTEKNGNPDSKADSQTKARGEAAAKSGDVVRAQAATRGTDAASAARRVIAEKRQAEERRAAAAEAAKRAANQARDQVRQRVLGNGMLLNPNDPNENMVTARLQALGKKEIFFVHKACGLTADERKKLKEALEQEIKSITDPKGNGAAGRRDVIVQQREDIVFMNGAQVRLPAGSYERVPAVVLRTARNMFPAEKRMKLEEEMEQRKKFRREGSVMSAILGIDREVSLTQEQRDKLVGVLMEKWDDSWGMPPELSLQNSNVVPPIPSRVLEGVLNEAQLKIWQGIPKSRVAYNANTINANQEMLSDDYDF